MTRSQRGGDLISDALPFARRAFRLLLVVAGVFMLAAAFVPEAHAESLIAYFNFEDSTVGGPPDFTSDSPSAFFGETTVISTNINSNALTTVRPGLALNRWPTDPDPNNLALGISRSAANSPGHLDIPLPTSQGFFQEMTVSFAIDAVGKGYTRATLFYSKNGGMTFTNSGNSVTIPNIGGQSSGTNLQNIIDNIRVEIVPEPTTIAGGLFGVLGLCWRINGVD